MAKNIPAANVAADEEIVDDFDYSKYLPEGYEADGLKKIGSLVPIYGARLAFEQGWDPVVGKLISIDTRDMGDKISDPKQRFREFALVELSHPTKAVTGSGENQKIVTLKKGEDVLVPVSGNIKNIRDLRVAAADPNNISLVVFRCTGSRKLNVPGKPSAMWVIDARIHTKTTPRVGRYLLSTSQVMGQLPEGERLAAITSSGEVYDPATGELPHAGASA